MAKVTSERVKHTYQQWCLMGNLKPVGDPWVGGQTTEYVASVGVEGTSIEVCHIQSYSQGEPDYKPLPTKRRAELVSAAPDLYRSLNDLLDIIHDDLTHARQEDHADAIKRADAAIAKAEGTPAQNGGAA